MERSLKSIGDGGGAGERVPFCGGMAEEGIKLLRQRLAGDGDGDGGG